MKLEKVLLVSGLLVLVLQMILVSVLRQREHEWSQSQAQGETERQSRSQSQSAGPSSGGVSSTQIGDAGKPLPKAESIPVQAAPQDRCFVVTYRHPKVASHEDGEACLKHNNLLAVQPTSLKLNAQSVCVQVNGAVVKHQMPGPREQIQIGPEAGPQATVQVQYCTGRVLCHFSCRARQDEFMAALGATDAFAADGDAPGWEGGKAGPNTGGLEKEVNSMVREMDEGTRSAAQAPQKWVLEGVREGCFI